MSTIKTHQEEMYNEGYNVPDCWRANIGFPSPRVHHQPLPVHEGIDLGVSIKN